jgi:hypothetical protein
MRLISRAALGVLGVIILALVLSVLGVLSNILPSKAEMTIFFVVTSILAAVLITLAVLQARKDSRQVVEETFTPISEGGYKSYEGKICELPMWGEGRVGFTTSEFAEIIGEDNAKAYQILEWWRGRGRIRRKPAEGKMRWWQDF